MPGAQVRAPCLSQHILSLCLSSTLPISSLPSHTGRSSSRQLPCMAVQGEDFQLLQ